MKDTTPSICSLLNFPSYAGILSLPLAMMALRSPSDFFWTSAEWRSGILSFSPIMVFPVPSGPWHMAHLPLNKPSPLSSALAGEPMTRTVPNIEILRIRVLQPDSDFAFMDSCLLLPMVTNPKRRLIGVVAHMVIDSQGRDGDDCHPAV